jgi:uracil-DNA glycosylase
MTKELARSLRAHAEWLLLCGVEGVPMGLSSAGIRPLGATDLGESLALGGPPVSGEAAIEARVDPSFPPGSVSQLGPSGAGLESALDLPALREQIGDCRLCRLCQKRTHLVFGVGNPKARLVFVGEGPGRDEDLQGEPFVGRAGQLLTDIIQKGMKLRREEVYICNVVKCRPPDNRNPEPDEVEACRPFLERQIELVGPEIIVALGKFAAQTLLRTSTPIMRLRGAWGEYRGVPLMPTLHPAYLLRNPADKRLVWEDIQAVMARLGLRA